jgi:hypothetical protein
MAIYTDSKASMGAVHPQGAVDEEFVRVEPLISGQQAIDKYLKGLPLYSAIPDPVTKKRVKFTPADVTQKIQDAIAELEEDIPGFFVMPVQLDRRLPFDLNEFQSFGFFKLPGRPISSVDALRIESSGGTNFFQVPKEWIDIGNAHWGQINILPLSPGTFSSPNAITGSAAAAVVLSALSTSGWIPAYWSCKFTVGFPDGKIPRVVNNVLGMMAAIEILGMLAATYATKTSQSLGIDGLSQSTSTPGPQIYEVRKKDLQDKCDKLVKKLKKTFGVRIQVGSI